MTKPYSAKATQDKDEQWLLDEKYGGVATDAFENDKKRLASGEPLAYIIGWQPFLGLKIHLDSHPLIPRPETEWWVEQMLTSDRRAPEKRVSQRDGARGGDSPAGEDAALFEGAACPMLHVLDLCAGSGAIGCAALAALPEARVSFGEVDPAHETTILKNIRENSLDVSRSDVRIGDLFKPFGATRFDLIAINPPYIPAGRVLSASVADHEPALALRSGEDGLDLIRRIAVDLPHHLTPSGEAWIEVDSAAAAAATALFTDQGLAADVRNDQYGVPRIVVVSFPHGT